MAQIASRGSGTPFGSGLVTVAELLSRADASVAPVGPEPPTEAISVGSLLRREGRGADAVRRDAGAPGRRSLLRRSALAAGAMVAVGSVFGAAVVTEASVSPAAPSEGYPGQGGLDAGSPAAPVTTVGTAAQSSALDSGTPAPTSWMHVGFPGAAAGSTTTPRPAPSTTHATPRSTGTPAPAAHTSTPSSSGTGSGDRSVVGTLGDTVSGVGKGTPLSGVTGPVGDTVSNLGDTPQRSRSSDDGGSSSSSNGGGLVSTVTSVLGGLL